MTASEKKPVTPSEDSLKKAQQLLGNDKLIDSELNFTNENKISEIFNENTLNEQYHEQEMQIQFTGFTTANGKKKIIPSEESLRKAQSMFNNDTFVMTKKQRKIYLQKLLQVLFFHSELSDALTECEFSVEYFSGDNGENIIVNASSIGAVDNKSSIKSLIESF